MSLSFFWWIFIQWAECIFVKLRAICLQCRMWISKWNLKLRVISFVSHFTWKCNKIGFVCRLRFTNSVEMHEHSQHAIAWCWALFYHSAVFETTFIQDIIENHFMNFLPRLKNVWLLLFFHSSFTLHRYNIFLITLRCGISTLNTW